MDEIRATDSDGDLLDAIAGVDALIASLTAVRAGLVDVAHRRVAGDEMARRAFRAEIACLLRMPERSADRLLDESAALVDRLPATLRALGDGAITPRHARVIAEETTSLDDDERAGVERRALAGAHRSTGEFRRWVRRLCDRRAPGAAASRHRTARARSFVSVEPGTDGMGWLTAHLPAPELVAIDTRLDELARGARRDGDSRTRGQLRAGAFADVLLDRSGRNRTRFDAIVPTVVLTVPAATVAGLDSAPGRLIGGGDVDPDTARELVAAAPWLRRMLVDPDTDAPLALGRRRYRPSRDMRLWLSVRDARCRFPGCTRSPAASDIDHTRDWARDGTTDVANLAHLCRRHHALKHASSWRVNGTDAGGTVHWTSPSGRCYVSTPDNDGVDPP